MNIIMLFLRQNSNKKFCIHNGKLYRVHEDNQIFMIPILLMIYRDTGGGGLKGCMKEKVKHVSAHS